MPKRSLQSWPMPMRYYVTNASLAALIVSGHVIYGQLHHDFCFSNPKGAEWWGEEEAVWPGLQPQRWQHGSAAVLPGRVDQHRPRRSLQAHLWRVCKLQPLQQRFWWPARGVTLIHYPMEMFEVYPLAKSSASFLFYSSWWRSRFWRRLRVPTKTWA